MRNPIARMLFGLLLSILLALHPSGALPGEEGSPDIAAELSRIVNQARNQETDAMSSHKRKMIAKSKGLRYRDQANRSNSLLPSIGFAELLSAAVTVVVFPPET